MKESFEMVGTRGATGSLQRAVWGNPFLLLSLPMLQARNFCRLISLTDQSSQLTIQTIALVGKLIKTNHPITSQQR